MRTIREIAEEEGLTFIETTDGNNGYPSNLREAAIGFDSFHEAEQLAEKEGMQVYIFHKRDGWDLWERKNPAYEPFTLGSEKYGDDYSEVERMNEQAFFEQEIRDQLKECRSWEEVRKLLEEKEKLFDEIESLGMNEVVITYLGKYYNTIKRKCMSYSLDTHNYAIGVIRMHIGTEAIEMLHR